MRPQTWADVIGSQQRGKQSAANVSNGCQRSWRKKFALDELRFISTFDYDAIRIEAYEIARNKARR